MSGNSTNSMRHPKHINNGANEENAEFYYTDTNTHTQKNTQLTTLPIWETANSIICSSFESSLVNTVT